MEDPDDDGGARERLLSAGAAMVAALRADDVFPGIRSVCRAAGLPTGSFYHCFGSSAAYYRELIGWLGAADDSVAVSGEMGDRFVALADWPDGPPAGPELMNRIATTAGMGAAHLMNEAQASLRAQFLLSGVATGDDELAVAIRESYAELYAGLAVNQVRAITTLVASLGAHVRPPFTVESMAVLSNAMVDGLVLRAQVDPGIDAITLAEDMARILCVSLLCGPDDHDDLDEFAAARLDALLARAAADPEPDGEPDAGQSGAPPSIGSSA